MKSPLTSIRNIMLGLVTSLLASSPAFATKTFCSMTLNSNDEIATFYKALQGQDFNFVELVPDNKDPSWFKKACDSGLKCDVLLVSGHFGGLFFGQGTSQTIGISEMEKASCNNSCPGILSNPKEVFLMGCNTLASQAHDHRTIEEYLNVLINDGIPLDFAEQVAASRYSQQGFSLEKRFSAIFNNSSKLYGFYSTGPLGKYAAPRLEKYLKNVGSYSKHLDQLSNAANTALLSQFKDVNFRETNPQKTLDEDSRRLYCALRSEARDIRAGAAIEITRDNKISSFFDSLASQLGQSGNLIANYFDSDTKEKIKISLNKISANNPKLVAIQHDVIKVASSLGIIDANTRDARIKSLLEQAYKQGLSYPSVSEICGIIKDEPGLNNLTLNRMQELSKTSPFFMLTLNCYSQLSQDMRDFLLSRIGTPNTETERTIALQIMKSFWNQNDLQFLQMVLQGADQSLRTRIYISARKVLFQYRSSLLTESGLPACVLQSESTQGEDLGLDWSCLTNNQDQLTPDICDHFASKNPDPENADDMRWYCWSNHKSRFLNSRAECYLLADTFKIRGNQMKQIWNCGNRDQYGY